MTTHYTAGQLVSKTAQPIGTVPNPAATWMLVENYFDYDQLIDYGDSGGPWFTDAYALGISHAKAEIEGVQYAIYMAIDYIDVLGVSVMTD